MDIILSLDVQLSTIGDTVPGRGRVRWVPDPGWRASLWPGCHPTTTVMAQAIGHRRRLEGIRAVTQAEQPSPAHYLTVAQRMQALHDNTRRPDGRRYTDEWVANQLGVSRSRIIGMRNARRYTGSGRPPAATVDFLQQLTHAYGKDPDYFLLSDRPTDPASLQAAHESVVEALAAAGVVGIQARDLARDLIKVDDLTALANALLIVAEAEADPTDTAAPPTSTARVDEPAATPA